LSTATVATRPRGWREIERRALELELRFQLVLEDCRRSGLYYIERFAYTVDEHRRTDNERPLIHGPKWIDPETLMPARDLDPDTPDDYLRYIAAVWLQEPLVLVPKSRQLRLSHLMVHLHGWLAMFYPGQLIGFQSKKFEDADALLRRLDLGLRAQRKFHPHIPWPPYKRIKGAIIFPETNRMIMAFAQGDDKVRSHTLSALFSDEMAFQEEAEAAYTAALPTIEGGGKFTGVSSAHHSFFWQLVMDKLEAGR